MLSDVNPHYLYLYLMAKHRAKFGWPPLNDVAAVTKPRCETQTDLIR